MLRHQSSRRVRFSSMRTKAYIDILGLLLLAVAPAAADSRPVFSGVWKLRSARANYSEIWRVTQSTNEIQIRMEIKDAQLGDRVLDFSAPLDGLERKQTVFGTPASVKAAWDGDVLVLEIRRQARPDLSLHNRRRLRLTGSGRKIESRTMQFSPAPGGEREEAFDRQ